MQCKITKPFNPTIVILRICFGPTVDGSSTFTEVLPILSLCMPIPKKHQLLAWTYIDQATLNQWYLDVGHSYADWNCIICGATSVALLSNVSAYYLDKIKSKFLIRKGGKVFLQGEKEPGLFCEFLWHQCLVSFTSEKAVLKQVRFGVLLKVFSLHKKYASLFTEWQ